jgi:hypothetical protein
MSSWVRDSPLLPPKKVEEFTRLPKEIPEHKNSIVEVQQFPAPSRLFQQGPAVNVDPMRQRKPREGEPLFVPISDSMKNDPTVVKTFDSPSTVAKPKTRRILPLKPEPFVSLATQPSPKELLAIKSFESPSQIRPTASAVVRERPKPAAYEPKNTAKGGSQGKKNVSQMGISANPQITIVIPLYNGVEFLEEALQSVKRQTYTDWTGLIGVNGHGQTGEPVLSKATEIVYNLGLASRFTVINLPDVRGAANAINHMVGMSTTPYIAHLDADDLWLSKKLEYQMSVYEQDQSIGIVGAMCRYFGDSNEFKILPPGLLTIDDFTTFNPLIHSSILIRRERAVYSDEFVAYDYDCWVRNVKNGTVIFNINNILVLHRIHSKSYYNTSGKQDPELIKKKYGLVTPPEALVKVN